MLAQAQKDPLTVWLGRVHCCWLLPDLAKDLLRLPDGFACSRQVWRCLCPHCFYGRTFSHTVPAYCTGPACWKRHKFRCQQNMATQAVPPSPSWWNCPQIQRNCHFSPRGWGCGWRQVSGNGPPSGTAAKVRHGRLLCRHHTCVKSPGSGLL